MRFQTFIVYVGVGEVNALGWLGSLSLEDLRFIEGR